jgi:hypothetical protein
MVLKWNPYGHRPTFPAALFSLAFNLETTLIRLALTEASGNTFEAVDPYHSRKNPNRFSYKSPNRTSKRKSNETF